MQKKAVALLSGGLDSTLAVKLIQEQGFEVIAVNMVTPFCNCNRKDRCEAKYVAEQFGLEIKVFNAGAEYLQIVRQPKYGYGKNMNPCLDCRILLFSKAREYMQEIGAAFVFTGEVLGQRPMSQHKQAMCLIEKEAGLTGRLLRPLSAKLLDPTIPEQEGLLKREKLLDFQGRTRKPQMALARELAINDYPCPAGGCLLTDSQFAARLRDLFDYNPGANGRDIQLLKIGRHFRLNPQAKLVVGRDEAENARLLQLAIPQDMELSVLNFPGPLALLRASKQETATITQAAALVARYSDGKHCPQLEVQYRSFNNGDFRTVTVSPSKEEFICRVRI